MIDLHPQWCGGCEIMNPTFNATFNNYADADKRLAFFSIKQELTNFTEGQKLGEKGKLGILDFGSEPKFIFFLVINLYVLLMI